MSICRAGIPRSWGWVKCDFVGKHAVQETGEGPTYHLCGIHFNVLRRHDYSYIWVSFLDFEPERFHVSRFYRPVA